VLVDEPGPLSTEIPIPIPITSAAATASVTTLCQSFRVFAVLVGSDAGRVDLVVVGLSSLKGQRQFVSPGRPLSLVFPLIELTLSLARRE
jgi:hypothetical protein